MRLAWTSDIHLNHADLRAWDAWTGELRDSDPDGIIITGDLSEADDVSFQLRRLVESVPASVFFVLGNHDFYGSSIASTRRSVSSLAREVDSLHYLTDLAPIELGRGRFLVGEDGWGDGVVGDYDRSPVRLNDFQRIEDFRRVDPTQWPTLLRRQGAESAQRLRQKLEAIGGKAESILIATHVPPFRESCWYEGKTTDDFWAPFFVCGQVGEVIRRFAEDHREIRTTVLCGHTHHDGTAEILPNLIVHTATAEYGTPRMERLLEV